MITKLATVTILSAVLTGSPQIPVPRLPAAVCDLWIHLLSPLLRAAPPGVAHRSPPEAYAALSAACGTASSAAPASSVPPVPPATEGDRPSLLPGVENEWPMIATDPTGRGPTEFPAESDRSTESMVESDRPTEPTVENGPPMESAIVGGWPMDSTAANGRPPGPPASDAPPATPTTPGGPPRSPRNETGAHPGTREVPPSGPMSSPNGKPSSSRGGETSSSPKAESSADRRAAPPERRGPSARTRTLPTRGEIAAAVALRQLGRPYVWGGGSSTGPTGGGFDCSGLALHAWSKAGARLAHYTGTQFRQGRKVPFSRLRPGDLVFFGGGAEDPTHVGVYLKDGIMIHAPKSGDVVRAVDFTASPYYRSRYRGAVRPSPS